MPKFFALICFCAFLTVVRADAQPNQAVKPDAPPAAQKANRRPAEKPKAADPFDKATIETMRAQCVRLETGAGIIELEMFPESAPETVRSFLNLAAIGAFDTTAFSRVVPGFVVQGGNLSTRENLTPELAERARRTLPDEPSLVRHQRGIVSMARPEEPNRATTHFFFLVGDAPHLDGKFAAFARVAAGMETVDAINKMPVEGEKPSKPIRINRARVAPCPARAEP